MKDLSLPKKKTRGRRYRLHRNLKPFFKVEARKRTVHVSSDYKRGDNDKVDKWINELIGYHYNIQITIA